MQAVAGPRFTLLMDLPRSLLRKFLRNGLCVVIQLAISTLCFAHAGHDIQLQRLSKAIAAQPDSQTLYIERAALHTQAHRFADAQVDFERADALGPPVAADYHRALFYEV